MNSPSIETIKPESIEALYDNFKRENQRQKEKGINDYCLLNSVLKRGDEVRLHSRFIYSMLDCRGMHYCGAAFLNLFLKSAGITYSPDDLDNAKVFKEDDGIDILIKIGSDYIIVENKLYAADQNRQITRYIKTILRRIDKENSGANFSDKIQVVYLSHHRPLPSNQSIEGFQLDTENRNLIVNGDGKNLENEKDKHQVTVHPQSSFPFVRLDYLHDIRSWLNECKIWLLTNRPNNTDLMFAFNDYSKVIDRLDHSKSWKNVLSLSDFVLAQSAEIQEEFFLSMLRSLYENSRADLIFDKNESIEEEVNEFMIDKILKTIDETLPESIFDKKYEDEKKSLNRTQLKNWVFEKGKKEKWKNIGVTYTHKQDNSQIWIYFGQQYSYVKRVNSSASKATESVFDRENRIDVQIKKDKRYFFQFLEKFKEAMKIQTP